MSTTKGQTDRSFTFDIDCKLMTHSQQFFHHFSIFAGTWTLFVDTDSKRHCLSHCLAGNDGRCIAPFLGTSGKERRSPSLPPSIHPTSMNYYFVVAVIIITFLFHRVNHHHDQDPNDDDESPTIMVACPRIRRRFRDKTPTKTKTTTGGRQRQRQQQANIVREIQKDFERYRSDIKEDISQSILARYLPESMPIGRDVKSDEQVEAAVKLLTTNSGKSKFDRILARQESSQDSSSGLSPSSAMTASSTPSDEEEEDTNRIRASLSW